MMDLKKGKLKNKGNVLDRDKKTLKGKHPKNGKGKFSSGFALTSGRKKGKVFFNEELRKSNKKLMEDIRKAINSSYGKKLAESQKVNGLQ